MKKREIPSVRGRGLLSQTRWQSGVRRGNCQYAAGLLSWDEPSLIQWPTARELQQVSATLAKVSRTGMRHENAGDYSTSGELAYQLQEILRATATLLKKSRRTHSQAA